MSIKKACKSIKHLPLLAIFQGNRSDLNISVLHQESCILVLLFQMYQTDWISVITIFFSTPRILFLADTIPLLIYDQNLATSFINVLLCCIIQCSCSLIIVHIESPSFIISEIHLWCASHCFPVEKAGKTRFYAYDSSTFNQ